MTPRKLIKKLTTGHTITITAARGCLERHYEIRNPDWMPNIFCVVCNEVYRTLSPTEMFNQLKDHLDHNDNIQLWSK